MNDVSDTILTKLIKKGDKKAFEEIYDRYHLQLYYLAKQYLKDQKLSEDALQDTFLKLWNKRKTLDSSRSISAFLFTIMKNHVLDLIRKDAKRIPLEYDILEYNTYGQNTTEEDLNYNQVHNIVTSGLQELPAGKREIFKMRIMKGFSNVEIAEKLQISVNTVKSQLYHGTKFIRTYLKKHSDI